MIISNLPLWLAIVSLVVVAAVCLEVGIGWRRIAHLKDMPPADGGALPRVSIIVSALNEADTIEPALRSLLRIDYPNLEVIVINDRSSDATPAILDRIAGEHPGLRVLHLAHLPHGWLGKNHALQQGASYAQGDYLLFTDADAVFDESALRRAIGYCEQYRVDHLTLFFDLVARTQLLRIMILSFATGFMSRFKPWKVNESTSHYVGVGGFNLVRRRAYLDVGGHAAMPLAVLDDMVLGRRIKEHGYRQHVLFGTEMVTIEWYRSTPEMARGMEKNIFSAFDYRLGQLVAVTLLMIALRIWPWIALFVTSGITWWLNAAIIVIGLALYADLLHARGWSYRCLFFAPAAPLVELLIWWRGSVLALARQGIDWRGTRYPLKDLRRAHNKQAPIR